MTGPEHYEEAERLLTNVPPSCECPRTDCEHGRALVAEAQVHATLALAAATALCQPTSEGLIAPSEWHAWNAAAGAEKP